MSVYVGSAWPAGKIYLGDFSGLVFTPAIVAVSELHSLGTLTITLAGNASSTTGVTINGISAGAHTVISDTQISVVTPKSVGVAFDASVPIVVTNSAGSSAAFSTPFLPPVGYTSVLLQGPFTWAVGSATGDYCAYRTPVVHEGEEYPVSINSTGGINFSDAPLGISTDVFFLDASAGYAATLTQPVYADSDGEVIDYTGFMLGTLQDLITNFEVEDLIS